MEYLSVFKGVFCLFALLFFCLFVCLERTCVSGGRGRWEEMQREKEREP